MRDEHCVKAYWSRDPDELLIALSASNAGLAEDEANARLARYGENAVAATEMASMARLLLRQVESPLVLILVFGACVSLLLREWTDAAIILLIVAGSSLLGFVQAYRASAAMARLRDRLALKVTAVRGGAGRPVDARRIVPGDIVELSAGNASRRRRARMPELLGLRGGSDGGRGSPSRLRRRADASLPMPRCRSVPIRSSSEPRSGAAPPGW